MNQKNFLISYDIGYASIGWCIMNSADSSSQDPDILGCGVVTFPTDDCLASTRRILRRTRRNIRATRMRIERLKKYLSHIGFLSWKELDADGHPAPFFLAARALLGEQQLTALELWQVLRFYAHNRGYDGNTRWANALENDDEEGNEDTDKLANAYNLMKKFEKQTMAETICAVLELDPTKSTATFTEKNPAYKTQNAAFPRNAVLNEVTLILAKHQHLLSLAHAAHLMQDDLTLEQRDNLLVAGIKLPKRYLGGLLFGQLVPRFDNRIIARCPITWAKLYDEVIAKENDEEKARHVADRDAKVPVKNCPEFYRYRWARLLANIKVDGKPLDAKCRTELTSLAEASGGLSKKEIEKYLKESLGKQIVTNLEAYFNLHPDSEDALVFDPAIKFAHSNAQGMQHFWPLLPDNVKKLSVSRWRKGKSISPSEWIERMSTMNLDTSSIDVAIKTVDKAQKEKKGKSHKSCLNKAIKPKLPSGRAAYSRTVLKQVFEEVMAGYDPTKPAGKTSASEGENKPQDGILYGLLAPGSRVRELESQRSLDSLTNNHLVRHRLLILDRLTQDIIKQYTDNQSEKVTQVIVEVARELKEFSGSTAKEISSELNSRLKNFKSAVKHLEENGISRDMIKGSLIRKCRIAMDLGWTCPFTNQKYDVTDLTKLEREHIIPYSTRATNALHALVLTFPEVNRMKGKRTARQFIQEHESQTVPNTNLSIMTLKQYDSFVDKLSTKGHPDDSKRMKARKALLATTEFDEKEQGFTEGHLTQSSHLIKLASRQLRPVLPSATINHIPGIVNAEIRKAWRLSSTLALACPDVIDENGKAKPKDEIRNITHLHHALDAATLGLCAHYIPLTQRGQDVKGKVWQAMLKRNKTEEEKKFLLSLRCFKSSLKDSGANSGTDVRLIDLPSEVKNSLSKKLAECRVVQHLPSDRSGARTDNNPWRLDGWDDSGKAIITKRSVVSINPVTGIRERKLDTPKSGATSKDRIFGLCSGKLSANKSILILNENFGLAITPLPTIIPFYKVHWNVYDKSNPESLVNKNGGELPQILRKGMIINILSGDNKGKWLITSAMGNLKLKITPVDYPSYDEKRKGSRKISISALKKSGFEIAKCRLCGT